MASLSHLRFIACCIAFFAQIASAVEVVIVGNDPRLIQSSNGDWDYSPDRCQPGFLAETVHGAAATLIFQGTSVTVTLLKIGNAALVSVYLDDIALVTNLDLVYPGIPDSQCSKQDVSSGEIANSSHNITLVHAGRSSRAAAGQLDWMVLIEIAYTTDNATSSSIVTSSSTTTSSFAPPPTTTGTGTGTAAQTSSNAPSNNQSAIIGGVVGGVVGGLLLGVAIAWYCLRKRRHPVESPDQILHGTTQVIIEDGQPSLVPTPWNPYSSNSASLATPASSSNPVSDPYLPPPPQYDFKHARN